MSLYHFSQHNSSVFFFSSNTTYFLQKQSKISDFLLLWLKLPNSHVIFQTKSQFSFKVWISFRCYERQFFCIFLAEALYAIIYKSSTLKCKFSDLPLLTLKFTKFLMSFLELRVSVLPNSPSLFSDMRHNTPVLFHLNLYML